MTVFRGLLQLFFTVFLGGVHGSIFRVAHGVVCILATCELYFQGRVLSRPRLMGIYDYRLRRYYYFLYLFTIFPRGKNGTLQKRSKVGKVLRRPCLVYRHRNGNASTSTFASRGKGRQRYRAYRYVRVFYGNFALSAFLYFRPTRYT